jgi:hypothetical protein
MARKSSGDVRVSVGAETSDLRRGMAEAGGMVRGFQRDAQRSGTSVTYMSNALQALTGTSGAAGAALGAVSGVLSGLATGGIAGAVAGAIGGIIQAFRVLREDSADATKKAKDGVEALARAADAARVKLERMAWVQAGGSARLFDALQTEAGAADYRLQQEAKKRDLVAEIAKRYVDVAAAERAGLDTSMARDVLAMREKDLETIRAEITEFERQQQAVRDLAAAEDKADANKAARKAAEKAEPEAGGYYVSDEALQQARESAKAAEKQIAQDQKDALDEQMAAVERAASFREGREERLTRAFESEQERQKEATKKAAEAHVQASLQTGSAVGQMMAGLITGQMTAREVVAQTLQMALDAVMQTAMATITAHAGEAASGAAASQAFIPFAGPGLAAAAMGAMFALVKGLIGQIGARAFGGPVAAGQPYLVGERGPELMVPGSGGRIVPNNRLGGDTYNVTIQPLDRRGLENVIYGDPRGFRRGISRLARRRR